MKLALILLLSLFAVANIEAQSSINGHSHNDYEQKLPFKTAFEARMGSIEADVYFVNQNLFVAHEAKAIKITNTLDALYLKPLVEAIKTGKIYPLILLIDVKSQADSTLSEIVRQIARYDTVFTAKCPIQFVISGNRPSPEKWSTYPTFIQFDGRPNEKYTTEQLQRVGMISESFAKYSKFGQKDINPDTYEKMKTVVDIIHAQKKKVRFWATPDNKDVWEALAKMGVDFINTDTPTALRIFLNTKH